MSVVFTDSFTVGSNTNIDAYPSGSPDYAYVLGSGTNIIVSGANDRAEPAILSADLCARIIDAAGAITGDQEITAGSVRNSGADNNGTVWVRVASGSVDGYVGQLLKNAANEVSIWRVDGGSFSNVANADRGFADVAATHSYRLRATGSGATVTVTFQVDATSELQFADTSGTRKTSGVPGIGGYSASGTIWVDDISVDNLAAAVADTDWMAHRSVPINRNLAHVTY